MVDPDDLRFVLAIERHGSLSAAARALSVDKATVIRRMDALEEALAARLVDRAPSGWRLTAAGRAAVATAERIEALLDELRGAVGDEAAGVVRFTAPAWITRQYFIPALGGFRERWPAVDLRIVTTNAILDLTKREADVAIRNLRPTQARLVCRRIGVLGCGVYASRTYVERRGAPTDPGDLKGHHVVGYEGKLVHPGEHAFLMDGVPVAFRCTDTLALVDALRAGLGLGSIPCAVGDVEPDLVRLPLPVSQDDIFVVFPDDLRDLPRVRGVVDWAAAVWASHQEALGGGARVGVR